MNWLSRLFPRKKEGEALYTDALECLLRGDTEGAFLKLRDLVKTDTSHINAYVKMGDILREKGKPDQAVKIHQSLKFRQNLTAAQKIEIHTSLARDYYALGRLARAEDNTNEVLRVDKKNAWAAEFLVQVSERGQRWEEASEYFKRVEKIGGKDDLRRHAYYRTMEGKAKEETGRAEDARGDYLKATKMDDTYPDPYLYLGNLYQREKNLEKAAENWMRFAELSPGSGKQVFGRLEKALFELGRFGQMEEFYRKLTSKDPDNMDALWGLINVLQAKGELDQAMALIDDILSRNEKSIPARLARLKLSLSRTNQDQLSAEVDEILKLIHPGNGPAVRSS
ncbi:MAG: tetratricopeptide repeat protein [Fidelibacterota bacterium]